MGSLDRLRKFIIPSGLIPKICRRRKQGKRANLRRGIKPDFANKRHAYKPFSKRLRHKHLKKLENGFCDIVRG
jgi:hypothetical protein